MASAAEIFKSHGLSRDASAIAKGIAALTAAFGNRVVTSQAVREHHGNTLTWVPNQPPDAVVFPQNTADVQKIVRICAANGVPVIPFGVGTSLEGHINAPLGGVSIDVRDMNKMLAVHAEDLDCVVEPGISRKALNEHLRDQGLFFPIDPGADASLGGMAATRCSGTNAVRYGTMKDNVLAMKVVMPDGKLMTTSRRAKKSSAGYDLTRLMIGSEGTLGVITELTLKLSGIPEAIASGVCPFPSVDAACKATILTIQHGIPVARIELLDALQIRAVNAYSKLSLPEVPTLFVEFHGSDAGVAEQSQRFGDIVAELGGGPFDWATKPEDRTRLWQARHDGYWAARHLRPGAQAFATDVCVPISRLAECVTASQRAIAELNLVAPILGHVGDGNFHLSLLVDMADGDEVERAGILMERVVELALSMDGTCTGEHGVGPGQDEISVGRARRAGARRHGGDQARARSAEHHESGQDRRARLTALTAVPEGAKRSPGRHRIAAKNRQKWRTFHIVGPRACHRRAGNRVGVGVAEHPARIGNRDHSGAGRGAGRSVADRLGNPSLAIRGGSKPPDRRRGTRHRSDRGAVVADTLAHAARHRDRRQQQGEDSRAPARLRIRPRSADARRVAGVRGAPRQPQIESRPRRVGTSEVSELGDQIQRGQPVDRPSERRGRHADPQRRRERRPRHAARTLVQW